MIFKIISSIVGGVFYELYLKILWLDFYAWLKILEDLLPGYMTFSGN